MLHTINLHSRTQITFDAFMDCVRLENIYIVKDVRGGFKFLDYLPANTILHCRPESKLVNFVYEGHKIIADMS